MIDAGEWPPLWLLVAMTGAGREDALEALERAGVATTDNLPVGLLAAAVAQPRSAVAVVSVDARQGEHLAGLEVRVAPPVLFLDAPDSVLVRRLHETTQRHPCSDAGNGPAAVAAERRLLGPLRAVAEVVIDTGELPGAEVGRRVVEVITPGGSPASGARLVCTVSSFGFKHGPQLEADWVIDVRFLPNPFWVSELRPLTGLDASVSAYVLAGAEGSETVARLTDTLLWVTERSQAHGRRRLHVAIGCTGGRHRSVAVAEALAASLREAGVEVVARHRDVALADPR
ncbi:MAG TPA: RNase adapter RapZ [Candidatus Dormibacteraeota bacterium]